MEVQRRILIALILAFYLVSIYQHRETVEFQRQEQLRDENNVFLHLV